MIVYNIVTIVCLLLMGVGLASVIAKIALTYKNNKREERIEYVREYKKGRMVLIYIFVFPLFIVTIRRWLDTIIFHIIIYVFYISVSILTHQEMFTLTSVAVKFIVI